MLNMFHMMFMAEAQPHINRKRVILEIQNEFCLCLTSLTMLVMTGFVTDNGQRFENGMFYVYGMCGILFFNIKYMLGNIINEWRHKRAKEKNQKLYEKTFKIWYEHHGEVFKFKENKRKQVIAEIEKIYEQSTDEDDQLQKMRKMLKNYTRAATARNM